MSVAQELVSAFDPSTNKAVLFRYTLYLLPNGDMQSAVSNIDPEKIKDVLKGHLEDEEIGIYVSAITYLLNNAKATDKELENHLKEIV